MDTKSFAIGMIATVIVGSAGYYAGMQKSKPASAPVIQHTAVTPTNKAPTSMANTLPGAHPTTMPAINVPAVATTKLKFDHFRVGNKNVKAILADGPVMWIGTSGGVIRYDTRDDSHKIFDTNTGLLANGIFHLSKLNGKLVAGTYGGGLSILNEEDNSWKTYNVPQGLADAFVYDVLEMDNGDVWIATWSGANLIRGGDLDDSSKWETFTVKNTNGGLPSDWIYALRKGKNGEVWMATEGGLARYKDGEWNSWNHKDGLGEKYELVKDQSLFKNDPSRVSTHHAKQKEEMGLQNVDIAYNPNYIISILVDHEGTVWTGTWGGGLARYKNGKWRNYTMVDGLPANYVSTLVEDTNGIIWVGTSHGLSRFDGEKFKVYTVADGLFSNSVFSMAFGDDGSTWVGSYGGVTRFYDLPR